MNTFINNLKAFYLAFRTFVATLSDIVPPPAYQQDPATLHMNQPIPPENPDVLVAWDTKENCRHNVRVICDLEGMTEQQKDDISKTIHCESDYNPNCVHPNYVNGQISSTDFGIAQVNSFWHIGPAKDFPSPEYVIANPEECVRWMCKNWKTGANMWVCHLRGLFEHYTA